MPVIRYANRSFALAQGQSVLECLTSHAISVPSSCRAGICQTCMLRASGGTVPAVAQEGLSENQKIRNYFLACVCRPEEDLEIAPLEPETATVAATVSALMSLNAEILHVALVCPQPFDYRPGQFINLFRSRTEVRSYSIASVPQLDPHVHLHVRRLPEGRVSGWIHEALLPGETVHIQGPLGNCFYTPGQPNQPLMLVGTGSGLAPLFGILRDALHQGHAGPIRLYHGSRDRRGLYLEDELRALTEQHANFSYAPCLSGQEAAKGYPSGRAHDVALRETPDLKGWRVFLCGHPDMVNQTKRKAFLAGAAMRDIHADPFTVTAPAAV